MAKITVQNTQITVVSINERDYISLTDMVRNIENGLALIEKWLRNKNTIEFLGIWEEMYNPEFFFVAKFLRSSRCLSASRSPNRMMNDGRYMISRYPLRGG